MELAKIAKALAKAQSEFPVVKKTKEGQIGNLKYKYATLSNLIDAIKGPFHKNGLCFTQVIHQIPAGGSFLETILIHESGEHLQSHYELPSARDTKPQEFGKLLTYARRYSLEAISGLCSEDDTDGAGSPTLQSPARQTSKGQKQQLTPPRVGPVQHRVPDAKLNADVLAEAWKVMQKAGFTKDNAQQLCIKMFDKKSTELNFADLTVLKLAVKQKGLEALTQC